MLLVAFQDETYCPRTQSHVAYCTGTNHVCYRCGFLFGPCDHKELGSLLDY
jgi:hypothetical protein